MRMGWRMNEDLHEIFKLAAKYFFKKYRDKGGSQAKLAQELGVTQPYICHTTIYLFRFNR
jgi:hypothetical protein